MAWRLIFSPVEEHDLETTRPGAWRLRYALRKPRGPESRPWPLLLFLHGAGERGTELGRVRLHGPWKAPASSPFLLVAPQCPQGATWPELAQELIALVSAVRDQHRVDSTRLYVTGLSLGAFGAWAVVAAAPGLFAAIVPICGGFALPVSGRARLQGL